MTGRNDASERWLKLRALLSAHFLLLAVLFLSIGVLGAGVTYDTQFDPDTVPVETIDSEWEVTTTYDHAASVTEENTLYPVGHEFDDRETYIRGIAPEANVSVETTYRAASSDNVSVALESTLLVRSVDEEAELWREEHPLDTTEANEVDPDEPVEHTFTLNVSTIDDRIDDVQSDLGGSTGHVELAVRTDVDVNGTVDGEPTGYAETIELPIEIGSNTYTIADSGPETETITRTGTDDVEREYGPFRSFGGPITLVVGLVGVGLLGYGRYVDIVGLSAAERARLTYLNDRTEYDEWITTIRLPDRIFEYPRAEAESLESLVNFAIDADSSVIADPDGRGYVVPHEGLLYVYEPPSAVDRTIRPDDPESVDRVDGITGNGSTIAPIDGEGLLDADDGIDPKDGTDETSSADGGYDTETVAATDDERKESDHT